MKWRKVRGYPYEVSDAGRVRRIGSVKVLALRYNQKGYVSVALMVNGTRLNTMTHRVVAAAFLGRQTKGFDVDHINGVRDDNRAANLRYLPTHVNRAQGKCLLNQVQVDEIRRRPVGYGTLVAMSKEFSVSISCLQHIRFGRSWQKRHE